MSRVLIGTTALKGKLTNFAERFDMVEVRPVDTSMPKANKLAKWREQVGPSFAFSVVLPAAVAALDGDATEALDEALEAARLLQASVVVLATTSGVRPTAPNRSRVIELGKRLHGLGHQLGWHAAGIWEDEDVMATAHEGGWLPIFDAAQSPLAPGPIVYTRIRAIGHATRLGADRIELIAHQIAGRREAFVVVEGPDAAKVRAGLVGALSRMDNAPGVPMIFRAEALSNIDDEEQ